MVSSRACFLPACNPNRGSDRTAGELGRGFEIRVHVKVESDLGGHAKRSLETRRKFVTLNQFDSELVGFSKVFSDNLVAKRSEDCASWKGYIAITSVSPSLLSLDQSKLFANAKQGMPWVKSGLIDETR